MPVNMPGLPALSYEQNTPVLSGYHQSLQNQLILQEMLKQKIANAIAKSTMQYAPQQTLAALQGSQLANQGAGIANQQNQLGLDVARNQLIRKGLMPGGQSGMPQPLGDNMAPSAPSGDNQQLPMSNDQIEKLKKIFGEKNVQNAPGQIQPPQQGMQQPQDGMQPGMQSQPQMQQPTNAYQQNQQNAQDYQALATAFGASGKGGTYVNLANQAREGTPQQREQIKSDTKRIAEIQDSGAAAKTGTYYLNDFENLLQKMNSVRFVPGIGKVSGLTSEEYQSLQRDAEIMGNQLPHLFGVPAKGFNVKLEESLRRIAGNPHGQLKGTLEHDVENLRQLFDRGIINSALAPYHRDKKGDLSHFSPYGGNFEGYFDSKEEYHQWLKQQPSDVQAAVHRQMKKMSRK